MKLIHETRTKKPSFMMRLVKWVISKRPPDFPRSSEEVETFLAGRSPPKEADIPESAAKRCKIEQWEVEGQVCVTLSPKEAPSGKHILYFHGGGFILPISKEHWEMLAVMVERLNVTITSALYDLTPEHSYANGERLADAAYAKLLESVPAGNIVLGGDSAGAHMALTLALRLLERGDPMPGKLALFAPWLDITMADPAMREVEPHDMILKIDALQKLGAIWAEDRDPKSPACSPLYAGDPQLAQLPPTAIFVGTHDVFVIDSRSFAARLAEAGVATRLYEYAGAPHVYMIAVPTREAKDTFELLGKFLEASLDQTNA